MKPMKAALSGSHVFDVALMRMTFSVFGQRQPATAHQRDSLITSALAPGGFTRFFPKSRRLFDNLYYLSTYV